MTSIPILRRLLDLAAHDRSKWLFAQLDLAEKGLQLHKRLAEVQQLGGDNQTRLRADAGLSRTARLCSALHEFSTMKSSVEKQVSSLDEIVDEEQRESLKKLNVGIVCDEQPAIRLLHGVLNLQSARIETSLTQILKAVRDRTQKLDIAGSEHSWKHDLTDQSDLKDILEKGKTRHKVVKATDVLRQYIDKLAEVHSVLSSHCKLKN